jgi:hypothetical protein
VRQSTKKASPPGASIAFCHAALPLSFRTLTCVAGIIRRHRSAAGLIWCGRWVTSDTVIECREALAFPGDPGPGLVTSPPVPGEIRIGVHLRSPA